MGGTLALGTTLGLGLGVLSFQWREALRGGQLGTPPVNEHCCLLTMLHMQCNTSLGSAHRGVISPLSVYCAVVLCIEQHNCCVAYFSYGM